MNMSKKASLSIFVVIAFLFPNEFHCFAGAQGVGVTFGRKADNLPPAKDVIHLCKSNYFERIRLYDPKPDVLEALKDSGIRVILGVINDDVPKMANDPSFPSNWLKQNSVPYAPHVDFQCIAMGDKLIPGGQLAPFVLSAMEGLRKALIAANLSISMSTVVAKGALSTSFPPSAGTFDPALANIMLPIVHFLESNGYPLLFDVYTYYIYQAEPYCNDITLDYALLNSTNAIVQDGQHTYTNLLDGYVDAIYSALEKIGAKRVQVVVSETGWPSCHGTNIATMSNAQTYVNSLMSRLVSDIGTPKRPELPLETYVHTLFNEDLERGVNGEFGLFYPNMTEVYPLNLRGLRYTPQNPYHRN